VGGTAETLEIARGPLRVHFRPGPPVGLTLWLEGSPGGIDLEPTPPAGFSALLAGGPRAMSRGDIKGRAAPAHRIEWLSWERGGPGLRLAIEIDDAGAGVTLETTLENRGTRPIDLEPLPVAACSGALPPLTLHRLWSDDAGHEESLLLGSGSGPVLWAGFSTGRSGFGRLRLRDGGFVADETGVGVLAPGESLAVDRLFLGRARDRTAALDAWARRAGAEMEAPMPARPTRLEGDAEGGSGSPLILEGRHVPGTGAAAWRDQLARLRAGLEGAASLSAAGPPLASTGLAHAMMPGDDALHLAVGSQRLWLLDLPLADAHALGWKELLTGLVGGVVRVSAAGASGSRALLPALAREASHLAPGVLRVPLLGDRVAILLCNTTAEVRPLGLDGALLSGLDLGGPAHGYEFGTNEPLGWVSETVPARAVAPGAGRLLALTPPADRPLVIGSNLHVGMGTSEVAALRRTPDGLVLVMRHPGEHEGDVWVAIPGEPRVRRVPVRFRDRAEIPLDHG